MKEELKTLSSRLEELCSILSEIRDWLNTRRVTTPDPLNKKPDKEYKCPLCSAPMKKRVARASGDEFYGCTKYPDCTGTRSVDGRNTSKPKRPVKVETEFEYPVENDDVPF